MSDGRDLSQAAATLLAIAQRMMDTKAEEDRGEADGGLRQGFD